MNIPRYWSKGTATEIGLKGKETRFTCWRGSNRSLEEAREAATADARRILNSFLRGETLGRYAYSDAPIREEILEEFRNNDGSIMAMLAQLNRGRGVKHCPGNVRGRGFPAAFVRKFF